MSDFKSNIIGENFHLFLNTFLVISHSSDSFRLDHYKGHHNSYRVHNDLDK